MEEIKKLCWEQLEPITDKTLTQILAGEAANVQKIKANPGNLNGLVCVGEEVTTENVEERTGEAAGGQ